MSDPSSTKPIRILFIIDNLQFGGGERVFSQIINGLNPDRYDIYLASDQNEQFLNSIHNPGMQYFSLNFSKRFNPISIFKFGFVSSKATSLSNSIFDCSWRSYLSVSKNIFFNTISDLFHEFFIYWTQVGKITGNRILILKVSSQFYSLFQYFSRGVLQDIEY